VQDFYNRNIEVPIDYDHPEGGTFKLYYQLSANFDYNQPSIFFLNDVQQGHGAPGEIDALAESYQLDESLNLVRYEPRGREYSYIELHNDDGTVNWEKAYRVLSSRQLVEDIERVRQDLFSNHPDTKICLFGRSGGGYLVQEYLAKYSNHVDRAFIRCAPNPLIMKKLGHLESKAFQDSLNAVDPALYGKLKVVLEKNIVPEMDLMWLMWQLPYGLENPGRIQAQIINELYENNADTYDLYTEEKGLGFAKFQARKPMVEKELGVGWLLRPLECDGCYVLGPAPEYIDPLYYCLRELSSQYIKLVEEKRVPPPVYPSLEKFKQIESEVFCLMGKHDHMSPYQIGIELGNYIKNYELFITDDNHLLNKHKDCYPLLRNAFFKYGLGSRELDEAMKRSQCKRCWPE